MFEEDAQKRSDEEAYKRIEDEKADKLRRKKSSRSLLLVIIQLVVSVLCVFLSVFLAENTSWLDWVSSLFQ